MEYFSLYVASHIANLCKNSQFVYNNTKIQKLMYCGYGSVLVLCGKRLCDEHPRAWQYGPVFPRVFKFMNKGKDILPLCPRLDAPNEILSAIDEAVKAFGAFSASSLSSWSHKGGSPWDTVVNTLEDPNGIIPDTLIAEYFQKHVIEA
jgi:uncharacterized phage-associated protein